jgi:dCTP deaminase
MILSDKAILEAIQRGELVIEPFRRGALGSNSYDVHLGRYLRVYAVPALDARRSSPTAILCIPPRGLYLVPGVLYLGVTEEYTETHTCVPFLEGKSSIGRLGIQIHATASKGDVGFRNHWTLEISVIQPVRVYPGMPIGQLIFHAVEKTVEVPYHARTNAHYTERSPLPIPSLYWKNFSNHADT